ncbi:SH3 domain-containing protein [Phytoactinopolyspora alkaliphila]|uniref:SH3 domain-containing protein n=1 Tax=Phytoactinopolyspora alkaliphila TaxID=1783498 RepID=A0A6N9YGK6_9ACTN|nr:SH3 domain-containing protein [Phytoactinopolyspora alkaliphila]NED94057.1 SH3 domain-containing protein [Phytoactinopolyspora alkaliphila]
MNIRHRVRKLAVAVGAATVIPLGMIATAPLAQASHAPYEGKVTASSLNVRSAPTGASAKAGSLSRGTTVKLQCKVIGPRVGGNDLWYKLANGNWVTARYVSNVGKAPRFCGDGREYSGKVIAQKSLAVRSGPSTANLKVSSAPRGIVLPIVCKVDNQKIDGNARWYQLTGDGGGQWVSARYVSNVGAAPPYC